MADQIPASAAARLVFGNDPQRALPMARVRVARLRGDDEIVDHPPAVGTIFEQIEAEARAVGEYNPALLTVSGGSESGDSETDGGAARRAERRRYPPLAVREAIVNAVVHRDYVAPGDVQVRVLDERIEFWNPGGLPPGIAVEDLRKRPHASVPRNGLIANAAYVARLFEGWGTGTTRTIELCRQAGMPDPSFREAAGGFTVTMESALADPLAPARLTALNLNRRQLTALAHVRATGGITNAEYRRLTGASKPTATRDLEDLIGRDLLVRVGQTGRGTRYAPKGSLTAQRAH